MKNHRTLSQLLRYSMVGAAVNLCGFAIYFFLTSLGATPKLTMSLLYAVVVVIGFFANRRFTFNHDGHIGTAGIRYLLVHLLGYLLNLTLLVLFVDWLGFAHQVVQAAAIVVVAIFLFVLSRFFVFSPQMSENGVIRS